MKTLTLSPMKILPALFWVCCQQVMAQVVVSGGTAMSGSTGTQLVITDDLTILSDAADFSKITLSLAGATQDLSLARTSSAITLGGLIVGQATGGNGGIKNLQGGTWEVSGSIFFNDGVVVPQTSQAGKILHSIASGTTSSVVVNNPDSYVNGSYFSKGTGQRYFPIGNGAGYFPAQLSNVTQGDIEIGMRVVNSNSGISGSSEILSVFSGQYWEITDASQSLAGPLLVLSTLGAGSYISAGVATVILGAPQTNSAGIILGGAPLDDFMVADKPLTVGERVFTFAQASNDVVSVKIHNVITPFLDNANDYLEIDNIHLFPDNKVMLLDRWGVLVKEWDGFTNVGATPDPSYDLSKLATGNYIAVLEYKDGTATKKLSQMVTIINQ